MTRSLPRALAVLFLLVTGLAVASPAGAQGSPSTPWTVGPYSGDGTATTRPLPVPLTGAPEFVAVRQVDTSCSSGSTPPVPIHWTAALDAQGQVWSWGTYRDCLGTTGVTWGPQLTPARVAGLPKVVKLESGSGTMFALDANGALWGWGVDGTYVLDPTQPGASTVPVRIAGMPALKDVTVGDGMVLGITTTGEVWLTGYGYDNPRTQPGPPTRVEGLSGVTKIVWNDKAPWVMGAWTTNGFVTWSWENRWGCQTYAGHPNSCVPAAPAGVGTVVDARFDGLQWFTSAQAVFLVNATGSVFAIEPDATQVRRIPELSNIASYTPLGVGAGAAIDKSGRVWFSNQFNEAHQRLTGPVGIVEITANGRGGGWARGSDGRLWAFGREGPGWQSLGTGFTGTNRTVTTPIVVATGISKHHPPENGDVDNLAITTSGTVLRWGGTTGGMVPGSTGATLTRPTVVPGLNAVSSILRTTAVDSAVGTMFLGGAPMSGIRGDWTGEGFVDLLGRNTNGNLYLYRGNGTGSVGASSQVAGAWGGYNYLGSPGDITGDKRTDLIGRNAAGTMYVFPGLGDGKLGPARQIGTSWGAMNILATPGDMDLDGRPDLVARRSDNTLHSYTFRADGSMRYVAQIGTGWGQMKWIIGMGDLNGDKRGDVVGVNRTDGCLYAYNTKVVGGLPRLTHKGKVGCGWNVMTWLTSSGDFNRDGYGDLTARSSDGSLWFYRGRAGGGVYNGVKVGTGWTGMAQIL